MGAFHVIVEHKHLGR